MLVDLFLHEVVELTLHDLGEFDLEGFDGSDGREAVVLAKAVDVELYSRQSIEFSTPISSHRPLALDPPPSLM